jgi:hypothetical protein
MQRIIACLLLNSLLLLNVQAQFGYEINPGGKTVTITNYSGPPDVIIPSTINGLEITSIGDDAFSDDDVTSVWIPYGVTNIGNSAFNACVALTNVSIPNSVTTIGDMAFAGAGLTSLTVPDSIANMGVGAFGDCGDLTNLTLDYGVSSIESNLFSGTALTTVMIPASVTNIGTFAFTSCDNLKAIFFDGNAPAVDPTAFLIEAHYGFENYEISNYYAATAYYLPGTTGWAQFMSNTLVAATNGGPVDVFVPAVLWNPTLIATGPSFGVQGNQFGFDITGTTNIPIVVQACTNLAQPVWLPLQSLTLTNGLVHFSEPVQSNSPARFYRIGAP